MIQRHVRRPFQGVEAMQKGIVILQGHCRVTSLPLRRKGLKEDSCVIPCGLLRKHLQLHPRKTFLRDAQHNRFQCQHEYKIP